MTNSFISVKFLPAFFCYKHEQLSHIVFLCRGAGEGDLKSLKSEVSGGSFPRSEVVEMSSVKNGQSKMLRSSSFVRG